MNTEYRVLESILLKQEYLEKEVEKQGKILGRESCTEGNEITLKWGRTGEIRNAKKGAE